MNEKHYHAPTQLTKSPFLTLWNMEQPSKTLLYIQTSEDAERPIWLTLGETFEFLAKSVPDLEKTLLYDMLIALRCNEAITSLVKNHIIK